MVSVAEQFGNLRHTLGSVLGIYTLIRWLRTLLAKLTVTGTSRAEALQRARRALGEFEVSGVVTNLPLYRKLVIDEEFAPPDPGWPFSVHTGWVDAGWPEPAPSASAPSRAAESQASLSVTSCTPSAR